MKHVGIICEFNPFHKGHAYLIGEAKRRFPEKGILCLMSGNFVQRGSFAVQEKFSRAKCAVQGGADLVLELPFPFSCLSAEGFGLSAVSVLSRIGIVDTLVFGSEIDDRDRLLSCAERLSSKEFQEALSVYLSDHKGEGYPAAREAVYRSLFGEEAILRSPNASLALEYLLAIKRLSVPLSPSPVLRVGEGMHSLEAKEDFASATALRKRIFDGESVCGLVPESSFCEMEKERKAGRLPVSEEALWPTLSYLIKTASRSELSEFYGFGALCDRAKRFCDEANGIEELVEKMKNACFTDSRIRRSLLALLCRVPRYAERETPLYTQVLGANEKGRRMLAEIKEASDFPVFTKPAHALRSKEKAPFRQASRAYLADEIYAMAFPQKQEKGFFLKKMPGIF